MSRIWNKDLLLWVSVVSCVSVAHLKKGLVGGLPFPEGGPRQYSFAILAIK